MAYSKLGTRTPRDKLYNIPAKQIGQAVNQKINATSALQKRGRQTSNIWIFHSPKIKRRFVVIGDVAFMHIVLLEGNVSVEGYELEPALVSTTVDGTVHQVNLSAHIFYKNGTKEWWDFRRQVDCESDRQGQNKPPFRAQIDAAKAAGVQYLVKTDLDLKHKEILFDNWLNLCAAINRCRNQPIEREVKLLNERLRMQENLSVNSLLQIQCIDRAHMLGAIGLALQTGVVQTDLELKLFGLDSILTRG